MDGTILYITSQVSIPLSELSFRTSRSGGPGGQNVNKVETKVEILFDVARSPRLSDAQRSLILERLKGRIDSSGILRVTAQQSRSQFQNKEFAVERLTNLLRSALKPTKARVRTKPTRKAKANRLSSKRHVGEKKRLRKLDPD
jgi:ribosome-associated protein